MRGLVVSGPWFVVRGQWYRTTDPEPRTKKYEVLDVSHRSRHNT